MAARQIAVIGAGPTGLEAALMAARRGFEPVVLEQGRVAQNVRSWGHIRLFTPFKINSSQWGRQALAESSLPADDAILTGAEFFEQYLLPLSRLPQIAGSIRENRRVVSIGRQGFWKADAVGSRSRRERPFSILTVTPDQEEELVTADYVLDCSGTYGRHNWMGDGGIPARGERKLSSRIEYHLPDIEGTDRNRYAGRSTLVVGSGYSAATAIVALANLATDEPDTSVIWITRSSRPNPVIEIADDSLPERAALAKKANALATRNGSALARLPGCAIRSVELTNAGRFQLHTAQSAEAVSDDAATAAATRNERQVLEVDNIIANVGYRPDRSLYEELQVHECYATAGPMKLAAALMGESSADCMAQKTPGEDTLRNPEPGFFILGAKSYGRDSRFLLRTGLQQIASAFSLIESEAT